MQVARVDGLYRRTLVAEQMDSPRAIALDPGAGLVFWSDWDQAAPRIERCSPAGRRRTALLRVDQLSGGAWPNGLALDHRPRRLYWIDARSVPAGTSCGPTRPRVTRPYLSYTFGAPAGGTKVCCLLERYDLPSRSTYF